MSTKIRIPIHHAERKVSTPNSPDDYAYSTVEVEFDINVIYEIDNKIKELSNNHLSPYNCIKGIFVGVTEYVMLQHYFKSSYPQSYQDQYGWEPYPTKSDYEPSMDLSYRGFPVFCMDKSTGVELAVAPTYAYRHLTPKGRAKEMQDHFKDAILASEEEE